jgi:hypothetical protein
LAVCPLVALETRRKRNSCRPTGAIFPAQAILLGHVLDVTNAPNMVSRGSFYALMFFVMAIASLIVYFVMGWATNIIAQVNELFDPSIETN